MARRRPGGFKRVTPPLSSSKPGAGKPGTGKPNVGNAGFLVGRPLGPEPVQPRARARPANNTTCDVYYNPNVPPAAPDVAAAACHLRAAFAQPGSESSEGDQDFRWTHWLAVGPDVDIRDSWPSAPVNRVYIPDKNGTGWDVVFVEIINRGTPAAWRKCYLNRRAPTFPTSAL